MLEPGFDWVIGEYCETGLGQTAHPEVPTEGREQLSNRGRAVEAHHVVGPVQHVDWHGVGEGVVVRVLQEDGENLHAGRFCKAGPVLNTFLQGVGTVGGILACLRSEMIR